MKFFKETKGECSNVWFLMPTSNFYGLISFILIFIIFICMAGCPKYKVWTKELNGKASLKESEWSKKVKIEEAKAEKESAIYKAQAEVERAKGVAEANTIIGESLKNNESYLRYLWIQGLQDGSSEIIYVPTEANLPILEATRGLSKK